LTSAYPQKIIICHHLENLSPGMIYDVIYEQSLELMQQFNEKSTLPSQTVSHPVLKKTLGLERLFKLFKSGPYYTVI